MLTPVITPMITPVITPVIQHVTVLALATLGGATQIASFLFFVLQPKVTKASKIVTFVCHCRWHFGATTLSITTFLSIMTLSIMWLVTTLSINDTQHRLST